MDVEDEVFRRFPGATLTRDNVAHFRGLLEHRIIVNRCRACGRWIYPLRPSCPRCWSTDVSPEPVSGRGRLYMFTVMHQGPRLRGFAYPHVRAAVELDEQVGLRYLAPLVDCPPAERAIGMELEVEWREPDGVPVAAFRPRTDRESRR